MICKYFLPFCGLSFCLLNSALLEHKSFPFFFFFFLKLINYLFIFSCVGSSSLCKGFLQLREAGATLYRGARASHYHSLSCCGAQAPDAQAQQLWLMGPFAPRHVGSSQTRARAHVPCIARQTLNHCATREAQEFSILMKFNAYIFSLVAHAFGVISKKPLTNSRLQRFAPMFCSKRLIVLILTFRSWIHFELIFVYGVWQGVQLHSFACEYLVVSAPLLKRLLYSH